MKLMLFALRTFSDTVTATEFAMTLTFDSEFATSYVTITFPGVDDVSISTTFEFRRILSFNCSATAAAVLPNPTPIAVVMRSQVAKPTRRLRISCKSYLVKTCNLSGNQIHRQG